MLVHAGHLHPLPGEAGMEGRRTQTQHNSAVGVGDVRGGRVVDGGGGMRYEEG